MRDAPDFRPVKHMRFHTGSRSTRQKLGQQTARARCPRSRRHGEHQHAHARRAYHGRARTEPPHSPGPDEGEAAPPLPSKRGPTRVPAKPEHARAAAYRMRPGGSGGGRLRGDARRRGCGRKGQGVRQEAAPAAERNGKAFAWPLFGRPARRSMVRCRDSLA